MHEFYKNPYRISTHKSELNIPFIHQFLSKSYWAKDIPLTILEKSIENSCCFGLYLDQEQVGFARVVTDYATFGYVSDVFIQENHRRKGLSIWLMECILNYAELQGFRNWVLATADAHTLYQKFGFKDIESDFFMRLKLKEHYSDS